MDHKDRLEKILTATPDEHRDWLGKKLEYSNEVGLRKRLKDLLKERYGLIEFSLKDINGHVNRITEIRNHFTHYSGEKEPKFATGEDFYVYDTLMQWTVTACLMEEIGIEREYTHKLIGRNESFLFFKSKYLKNRQVDIMKVESVRLEDIPASRVDESQKAE